MRLEHSGVRRSKGTRGTAILHFFHSTCWRIFVKESQRRRHDAEPRDIRVGMALAVVRIGAMSYWQMFARTFFYSGNFTILSGFIAILTVTIDEK